MKNGIAYTRVSTEAQAESEFGLMTQTEVIDTYARLKGIKIQNRFEDAGVSAMGPDSLKNRELRKAIELSSAKGWPIIVAGLDRLARNVDVLEKIFQQTGAKIISVPINGDVDPVVIQTEARRHQFVGEEISRRTKEALAMKKAEGVILGNPNIAEAQKVGAAATARKAEERTASLVPFIKEARSQNITAVPKIADFLNARGLRTARGDTWTAAALRRPLARVDQIIAAREKEEMWARYQDVPGFGEY